MSNLFASLNTASGALQAFQRSIAISQNNVSNASTPGFARQDAVFEALPFRSPDGLSGGVAVGDPKDSRDSFAEQSVRSQVSSSGLYSQLSASLGPLETVFDVSGKSGIPAALSQLFQSFSAWSVSPDSVTARQAVLSAAQGVAAGFQQASQQVAQVRQGADRELSSTVAQINALAAKIQQYNVARRKAAQPDPGLDAGLNENLESLARLTDIVPLVQSDGSVTVLMGGQTPLVMGDQQYGIRVSYITGVNPANPSAQPAAQILNADGGDITAQASRGTIGALLQVRNSVIPSLTGDAQQAGSLNLLAKQIADRVNQVLTAGQISTSPAQNGVPLFTYNANSAVDTAATLAVNTAIAPAQLAAIDPGPPAVSNGVALRLAGLPQSAAAADQIQGLGITDFFSSIAAGLGQQVGDAKTNEARSSDLVAQARNLRAQLSGVSLDQEAVRLVELQRSYQAAARVVTMMNDLADTTINILR